MTTERAGLADGQSAENDAWIEVEVTIETTTEEKARYKVDRHAFEEWARDIGPHTDLARKIKEFLRAGDEWEVCAEVHAASPTSDVVDCEVLSVAIPTPIPPGGPDA